jgi:tRNA (mo5U34)-methyltransferase
MRDYQALYARLQLCNAEDWASQIPEQLERAFDLKANGSAAQWLNVLQQLPAGAASCSDLNRAVVQIGTAQDLSSVEQQALIEQLKTFHPWRKGPYDLLGIFIDTEWRSDWKWDRLIPHITPLKDRLVLDVGCGNGYHGWRMLGAGADMVIGIDPLLLNVVQFMAIKRLYGEAPFFVLPIGIEQLPQELKLFDTVFSMGVLYHRRSPIDHLLELKSCLKEGGELVLETLVIDGEIGDVLVPEGRYAKMRNVWFIPSCQMLLTWMKRCGYQNARVVDVSVTTIEEQRSTEWMHFNSLPSFLHPEDRTLTVEGLPAPKRAIVVANI